jgi:NADH-quinone oxidoreductase subunit K
MDELSLLHGYLIVGALLFGIGVVGFISRRNLIVMFLAVEMMLQGVSLSLVAWGRFHNNWDGQMLVVFILAIAACEAAIALALVLMLFHSRGSLDAIIWQSLREANQPEFSEEEDSHVVPEDKPVWPTLAPAGVEPAYVPEEENYRSRV